MRNRKAPGRGGIPKKFAQQIVLEILRVIFDKCMVEKDTIPNEWKQVLYKIESKSLCTNYIGISVTDCIRRLYGRIIKYSTEGAIEIGEE